MKFISTLFITFLSVILYSCNDGEIRSDAIPDTTTDDSKQEVWNWGKYKQVDELLLGTMPVTVHPKRSLVIKSKANGELTLEINQEVSMVHKGMLWARMNMENLSSRQERLEIKERKQFLQNQKIEELDLPQKKAKAYEDLLEARKKVRMMDEVMTSQVMDEMSSLLGIVSEDITAESLKKAKESLSLAEKRINFLNGFENKLREDDKRLQEMDLTESKRKFEEARGRSEYFIPFDGEFRVDLSYVKGQQTYTVISREKIATLNDYTEIHAHLIVRNASWISLPPSSLHIKIKNQGNTRMEFLDDRNITNRRGGEDRNYIFSIDPENDEALKRLAGSEIDAELLHKLEKRCYLVPKLDLSLYAMERSNAREWTDIITELYPNAELIAEGLEDLAIYLPQT